MGECSVFAAACCGLRRRLGGGHWYVYVARYFFGVGGMQSFEGGSRRDLTMQGNGARDRKFQLGGDMDGEQWVDQRERPYDGAKLCRHGDSNGEQQ